MSSANINVCLITLFNHFRKATLLKASRRPTRRVALKDDNQDYHTQEDKAF